MDVKMNYSIRNQFVLLVHFQLGTVGPGAWMLLQILLHADPAVVLLQFRDVLWHRKVWISLPELADDRCSKLNGYVQGHFGWSFGALRLARDPHNIVLVDHQVFVEGFES